MSVGGEVIEVIVQRKRVYVDTSDGGCKCAIFVEKNSDSKQIKKGDVVWWQGNHAYWTTSDRETVVERKIKRIGFSGVNRPKTTLDKIKEFIRLTKS